MKRRPASVFVLALVIAAFVAMGWAASARGPSKAAEPGTTAAAAEQALVRRGSDGDVRWIKDVGFPLTDEQGRVQGVAGVGQDITAQKRAEEALREREERLV